MLTMTEQDKDNTFYFTFRYQGFKELLTGKEIPQIFRAAIIISENIFDASEVFHFEVIGYTDTNINPDLDLFSFHILKRYESYFKENEKDLYIEAAPLFRYMQPSLLVFNLHNRRIPSQLKDGIVDKRTVRFFEGKKDPHTQNNTSVVRLEYYNKKGKLEAPYELVDKCPNALCLLSVERNENTNEDLGELSGIEIIGTCNDPDFHRNFLWFTVSNDYMNFFEQNKSNLGFRTPVEYNQLRFDTVIFSLFFIDTGEAVTYDDINGYPEMEHFYPQFLKLKQEIRVSLPVYNLDQKTSDDFSTVIENYKSRVGRGPYCDLTVDLLGKEPFNVGLSSELETVSDSIEVRIFSVYIDYFKRKAAHYAVMVDLGFDPLATLRSPSLLLIDKKTKQQITCQEFFGVKEPKKKETKEEKQILSWDEYFMGIATLSSLRSKDPVTQVGACIVGNDNRILSIGYNGFPIGCSDQDFPWAAEADSILDTKNPYVVHSELNAILNFKGTTLEGSRMYVTLFPCNECAKAIIQAGIKEVIYLHKRTSDRYKASDRMFKSAGVATRRYSPTGINISIDL